MVACSALKQKYRDVLSGRERGQQHFTDVAFVSVSSLATRQHPSSLLGMPASTCFVAAAGKTFFLSGAGVSSLTPHDMQHACLMQVLLQPNKDVLAKRVQERAALGSHFMPASLLESQLALVEMDPTAYTYGIPLIRDWCRASA